MLSVFLSVALASAVIAGGLVYIRLRKRPAEPDYFISMLTQSPLAMSDDKTADTYVTTRDGRRIRSIDLEQIRAAGL